MSKNKKPGRLHKRIICRSFSGEYMGNSFEIKRIKSGRKVEYRYRDNDVGSRRLNKHLYKNLVKNSEVLYDGKKEKYIRYYGY